MKVAVIGAGLSGITIANLLKNSFEVTVFEKDKMPGGLIKCERIYDCLFHKVGGHVFNSKLEDVNKWFWSFFNKEQEFLLVKRNAKILLNNKLIGYPIENNLFLLEEILVKQIIAELLELQQKTNRVYFEYTNFGEFLKCNFGSTLFELYFKPYNEKIWKTDLGSISMDWLEGKLPMPSLNQILLNNILKQDEHTMVHASFYYPKQDGSQFIINRLQENINVRTNFWVNEVGIKNDKFIVGSDVFDKLIYCGDIRRLPASVKQILTEANADVEYIERLHSNGTSNLFCETDDTDISWLYLPETFTKAHRIIYTGNFSNTNNRGTSRKTCVVEFSGKVDYDVMCNEVKKLPGSLNPLTYNYEPNSYVIQHKDTRKQIAAAKNVLARHNIYLLGRFAEWEYYNMDTAIKAAFNLYQTVFN